MNIRTLAKGLNLSIGTVSKALKDSYEISAATKERVLAFAKKMDYTPNPYASSLRRKKSNTLAVVIPEVADSFFSLAIKGIEEVAQSRGFHSLIYLTYESYEKEKKILEDCRNGRVDGVLMSVSSETVSFKHIEDLHQYKIPVVLFDRVPDNMEASKITTNDFESAYTATVHLIKNHCRNIVYLSVSDKLDINNQRISGFKKALQDHALLFNGNQVINCSNDEDATETAIRKILKRRSRPDGVLASVEKFVIPVYALCDEFKISIPEQLKLICFSTTPYAGVLKPSLTTVTQPAKEIGKAAAALLIKVLGKKGVMIKPESIIVPSVMQIRQSAGR